MRRGVGEGAIILRGKKPFRVGRCIIITRLKLPSLTALAFAGPFKLLSSWTAKHGSGGALCSAPLRSTLPAPPPPRPTPSHPTLAPRRKRRIYDRYGPDALGRTAEGLFSDTFRAGEFSGVDDDKTTKTTRELEALRKENDTLQRQMLILKPEVFQA